MMVSRKDGKYGSKNVRKYKMLKNKLIISVLRIVCIIPMH